MKKLIIAAALAFTIGILFGVIATNLHTVRAIRGAEVTWTDTTAWIRIGSTIYAYEGE